MGGTGGTFDGSLQPCLAHVEYGKEEVHTPKWVAVDESRRLVENPWPLGKKTYWRSCCCGQRMTRYKLVQSQKCSECGKRRVAILSMNVAACAKCGHYYDLDEAQEKREMLMDSLLW